MLVLFEVVGPDRVEGAWGEAIFVEDLAFRTTSPASAGPEPLLWILANRFLCGREDSLHHRLITLFTTVAEVVADLVVNDELIFAGSHSVGCNHENGGAGESVHVWDRGVDGRNGAEEREPGRLSLGVLINEDADEIALFQSVFDIEEHPAVANNRLSLAGSDLFEELIEVLVAKGMNDGFEGVAKHGAVDTVHLEHADVTGCDDDTFAFVVDFLEPLGVLSGDCFGEVLAVKQRYAGVVDEQPSEVLNGFEGHVSDVRFGELGAEGVAEVPPHARAARTCESVSNDDEGRDEERDEGGQVVGHKFGEDPEGPECHSEEEGNGAVVEIFHQEGRIKGQCPELLGSGQFLGFPTWYGP